MLGTMSWARRQFANKGGSGSVTFAVNRTTGQIVMTITGTLTNQFLPLPSIKPSGVVSVYGRRPRIQPGAWISMYGDNLATGTTEWKGDFPTSLGGTAVSVNGRVSYLWFVSAGQINMQVPDDSKRVCVEVKVNTPNGSTSIQVEMTSQSPSLVCWTAGIRRRSS